MAPDLEINPCASLSLSLGLDQKWSVSVSVSTLETSRSQSQSRVSTRQGSGLSLSLSPKNLGLVGCWPGPNGTPYVVLEALAPEIPRDLSVM